MALPVVWREARTDVPTRRQAAFAIAGAYLIGLVLELILGGSGAPFSYGDTMARLTAPIELIPPFVILFPAGRAMLATPGWRSPFLFLAGVTLVIGVPLGMGLRFVVACQFAGCP